MSEQLSFESEEEKTLIPEHLRPQEISAEPSSLLNHYEITAITGPENFEVFEPDKRESHAQIQRALDILKADSTKKYSVADELLAIAQDVADMRLDPRPYLSDIYELVRKPHITPHTWLEADPKLKHEFYFLDKLFKIAEVMARANLKSDALLETLEQGMRLTRKERGRSSQETIEVRYMKLLAQCGHVAKALRGFEVEYRSWGGNNDWAGEREAVRGIELAQLAELLGENEKRNILLGLSRSIRRKYRTFLDRQYAGPVSAMPGAFISQYESRFLSANALMHDIEEEVVGKGSAFRRSNLRARQLAQASLELARQGVYPRQLIDEALARQNITPPEKNETDQIEYLFYQTFIASDKAFQARNRLWFFKDSPFLPRMMADYGLLTWRREESARVAKRKNEQESLRRVLPRASQAPQASEDIGDKPIPVEAPIIDESFFVRPPTREQWDAAQKELDDYIKAPDAGPMP
jgi:hypothetical protein